jgi:glycerol kinase
LAGLSSGLYAGTAELSAMWRAERSFLPSMSRDQAGSLMAKWEHAVRQTVLP